MMAPTMAMDFNVSLAVRAAGRAAPLAFAIGTIVLTMVALSFVSFSRRVPHAGSVYPVWSKYSNALRNHNLG
jgi:amino acid transporter